MHRPAGYHFNIKDVLGRGTNTPEVAPAIEARIINLRSTSGNLDRDNVFDRSLNLNHGS
jgi:hypothetical protein